VWRPAEASGQLRVVGYHGFYLDCGTPADYLAANRHAAAATGRDGVLVDPGATVTGTARESVVGAGATVRGAVTRCVVWPGATVAEDEDLTGAVRNGPDRSDTVTA
jgi:N-acetyl-alpha-D-muramate 1-phosphate uridylyltransferase